MHLRVLIAAALVLPGCCPSTDGRESAIDKHEWSILQSVEWKERNGCLREPEIRTIGKYEVLGVQALDGSTPVWVLLKPAASPFYKQMPEREFSVPKSLLDDLVYRDRVSATTEQVLRTFAKSESIGTCAGKSAEG